MQLDRKMFQLLSQSNRLAAAIIKAEVTQEI